MKQSTLNGAHSRRRHWNLPTLKTTGGPISALRGNFTVKLPIRPLEVSVSGPKVKCLTSHSPLGSWRKECIRFLAHIYTYEIKEKSEEAIWSLKYEAKCGGTVQFTLLVTDLGWRDKDRLKPLFFSSVQRENKGKRIGTNVLLEGLWNSKR